MGGHKIIALLFTASIFLNGCNDNDKAKNQIPDNERYNYVALKDIDYTPANIEPGTEVAILANLGGKKNVGDTVNYYLFIVINQKTLDTNLILCPEITIDVPSEGVTKTSTTPLLFNMDKGVTTAYFEPTDASKIVAFSDDNLHKLENNPNAGTIQKFLDPQHVVQMVVLDKKDTANRVFRFATAIGKLNFKQIPW